MARAIDFEGGLAVTEDNAFVEYGGTAYEVGAEMFNSFKEQIEAQPPKGTTDGGDAASSFQEGCEQAIEAQGGDPAACDFDIGGWFTNLSNEGTEDLEGDEAVHVSGDVDVAQMLDDLVGIAQSVPGASQQVDAGAGRPGDRGHRRQLRPLRRRRGRPVPAPAGPRT